MIPGWFPIEAVPDATVWAPHHAIYGGLVALLAAFLVVDDHRDHDPVLTIGATTAGLFGFLLVWPWYPVIGASMALGGYTLAFLGALRPGSQWWPRYPAGHHAVVVVGLAVGLDDVVDHAFPVPTPLDTGWAILGPGVSSILAVGAAALAMYAVSRSTTAKE